MVSLPLGTGRFLTRGAAARAYHRAISLAAMLRPLRLATLLALVASPGVLAQDAPLAVSVDCPGYVPGCDIDFFQTEVPFARFVRDQGGADVAVFITQQETGGGGRRYELTFRGRRGAALGRADTLRVGTEPGAADDAQRRALLGRLRLGLVGYAARTGLADRLSVGYAEPAATDAGDAPAARDPWNSWVFGVNGDGYFSGQQSSTSANLFGSLSASRVTERWKLQVRPNGSYNRSTFELDPSTTVVSANGSYGVSGQAVRALSARWSAGVLANARHATFQNYDVRAVGGPAVEYNLYDFAESTRRQLRLGYRLEAEAVAYVDTTLFGQTRALNALQTGYVAAVFAQPWGSSNATVEVSQILTRPDKYRATLSGNLDLRVAQGVNVRLGGYVALVRDQVNLPVFGATDEEILTQQRELATGYEYFANVGLNYTFGSIFNPAVNARFGN